MEMRPGTTGHYKLRDHVQPKNSQFWPTPRAAEWKGVGPIGSKSHKYRLEKGYLDATVQESNGQTGQLNPTWVEWLMGYPTGHTALKDWETPSYRKSRLKLSETST